MTTKATDSVLNLVSPPISNMVLSQGTLDNSTIGETVPARGYFTRLVVNSEELVVLHTDTTYYVNGSSGSDSTGDGTSGNPWHTMQLAWDFVLAHVDAAGHSITISHAGNSTQGLVAFGQVRGSTIINLILNGTLTCATGQCIQASNGAFLAITGSGIISATGVGPGEGYGLSALVGGIIIFQGISFFTCTAAHILANKGLISPNGDYSIFGNAIYHMGAAYCGVFFSLNTFTITITGVVGFSLSFANCSTNGVLSCQSGAVNFVGSATGARYAASSGGAIETGGGGANYFPGSSPGFVIAPGSYE